MCAFQLQVHSFKVSVSVLHAMFPASASIQDEGLELDTAVFCMTADFLAWEHLPSLQTDACIVSALFCRIGFRHDRSGGRHSLHS